MTLKSVPADDFAVLGVESGATTDEIHCAYRKKLDMWQAGALPTYNLLEPEERQEILDAIEAAYTRLLAAARRMENHLAQAEASTGPDPFGPAPERETDPGMHLRFLRQRLGFSLKDVEKRIKVNHVQLQAIEDQSAEDLPAPVFVRGFVIAYAELLKIEEPAGFANLYLKILTGGENA